VRGDRNKVWDNEGGRPGISVEGSDNEVARNKASGSSDPEDPAMFKGTARGVMIYGNVDERPGSTMHVDGEDNSVFRNYAGRRFQDLPADVQEAFRRQKMPEAWMKPPEDEKKK